MTKIFLKEILRKINKTSIYYPIFPRYTDDEVFFLSNLRFKTIQFVFNV